MHDAPNAPNAQNGQNGQNARNLLTGDLRPFALRRRVLTAAVGIAALAGCGSGDDERKPSYRSFAGSVNGEVVYDANRTPFRVLAAPFSDDFQTFPAGSLAVSDTELLNVCINGTSDIISLNSLELNRTACPATAGLPSTGVLIDTRIGRLAMVNDASGRSEARLLCTDGKAMDIEKTSGSQYAFTCS